MLAAAPRAAYAVDRYQGLAYARGSGHLVYRETHWIYTTNGVAHQLVLYQCPGGAAFARASIRDLPTPIAPDFDFLDGRDGHREGVRKRTGGREVYVQDNRHSPLRTRPLPNRPAGVIDAGFDAFIRAHWDELSSGASLEAPFLLPTRLEFVDFRIFDARNANWRSRPVLRLKMGLAAWYAFALPAIDLMYDRGNRQLLEYRGIGTIRDARGRNQNVRIEFPPQDRVANVPGDEVRRADALPLAGRCGG